MTATELLKLEALIASLEAATGDLEGLGALVPAKPDDAEVDYETNLAEATDSLNEALDRLREVRDDEQANS